MLTNEEKINLRERALRLAFELPIDHNNGSTQSWGDDIYDFLIKVIDDDPLKLDTPSPVWRHESEMSPEEYWRLHSKMHGIDWSRPQMVHSTTDPTMIIRVDSDFTPDCFNGTMINRGLGRTIYHTGASGTWDKSMFVYHGEISQEQQQLSPINDKIILQSERNVKKSGLSITDAVRHAKIFKGEVFIARDGDQYDFDVFKINHGTGLIECLGSAGDFVTMPPASSIAANDWQVFTLGKKAPQEQPKESQCANAKDGDGTCGLSCCICAKEEPKTTGLNFLEAVKLCKSGRRIGRKVWHPDYWLVSDQVDGDYVENMDGDRVSLNVRDALATDWQIVKS